VEKFSLTHVLFMFYHRFMDWDLAIANNRKALAKVLAEILALLGIVAGGVLEHLPNDLYAKANRLLRPAESALRRLIFIVAKTIVVKPSITKPMPQGLFKARGQSKRSAFQLYDPRPHYEFIKTEDPLFRIVQTYASNPFNLFDPMYLPRQDPVKIINAARFCRRLAALAHALDHIPQQARRLLRMQARRAAQVPPNLISVLRPGRPPGHQEKRRLPVDFILRECDQLSWDSYAPNTS
jgi:hypothetical protein